MIITNCNDNFKTKNLNGINTAKLSTLNNGSNAGSNAKPNIYEQL